MATHKLEQTTRKFNVKISTKTKSIGFQGKEHMKTAIVIDLKTIEQVRDFNYLGCNISYRERRHTGPWNWINS